MQDIFVGDAAEALQILTEFRSKQKHLDFLFAFCEAKSRNNVHVISFRKLQEASRKHGIGKQLDAWYRIAKAAKWTNLEETRRTYATADGVVVDKKVYTVFNIHGNEFRLIVGINYPSQTIFIKHVLTHADYSKGDWKK